MASVRTACPRVKLDLLSASRRGGDFYASLGRKKGARGEIKDLGKIKSPKEIWGIGEKERLNDFQG